MRYLLLLSSLELGGAERQAINFACYLQRCGLDVVIAGLSEAGVVNKICATKGIKCISFEYRRNVYSAVQKILNTFRKAKWSAEKRMVMSMAHRVKNYVQGEKFDACIAYCSTANATVGMLKKIYPDVVGVWYQRDAGIHDNPAGIHGEAIEYADCILANSKSCQKWIKDAYGKEAHVIHNGVELSSPIFTRKEWRSRLKVNDNELVCTMIANLSSAKNHRFLLELWNKLLYENDSLPCRLVFAGRFDDQYESLKEYVIEHNIEYSVDFLGQIEDVSGLLNATDICVFSSKSEGSPNGVIEACLQGLPVVATDLPEIRDVVSSENYGYLFSPENIKDAISKLLIFMKDVDLRHRVGQKNREFAIRMFSPADNYSMIVNCIDKFSIRN